MIKGTKRYIKLSALYFILTVGILFLIFKFGITAAVEISSFLQQKNKIVSTSGLYENVIPEPQLLPLPEATNSASLEISGYSLPNQKVNLYINDMNVKTFEVDSEGKFEGLISLSLGLSKIYAVAINSKNIQSSPSKSWTVFYNNSPPYLEILEPANNSTITGRQKTITIKGKISQTSKVFINNQRLITENDGSFSYPASLQQGENKFKIISLDPAQNKTELEWVLNYQP